MSSLTLSQVLAGVPEPDEAPVRARELPAAPLTATAIGTAVYVSFGSVDFDAEGGRLELDEQAPAHTLPFEGSVRVERAEDDVFLIAGGRLHLRAAQAA